MRNHKGLLLGCAFGLLLFICVALLGVTTGVAYIAREVITDFSGGFPLSFSSTPTTRPNLVRPSLFIPVTGVDRTDIETLLTLMNTIVPINDPADLAGRLLGIQNIPETYPDNSAPHQIGARDEFWVINTSTNIAAKVPTTLQYITDHAYYWIGDDVDFDLDELEELAIEFEENIYPTTRAFFGSEWNPGIDEDPRIYILYVKGVGSFAAAYFSSADSVHPLAQKNSNAHETFVVNAGNTALGNPHTKSILAHEFQHMIHWNQDRNESSWINEGFSEVADLINGYEAGGFAYSYTSQPDLQLNDWPNDGSTTPHYGSSFLFLTYFLERMGAEATQSLVANPANGLRGVDLTLESLNAIDPVNEMPIQADDLIFDWVLTNYILDDGVGDGRYSYYIYEGGAQVSATETIDNCESGQQLRDVHQYGVDYIRITCEGQNTLRFEGSIQTTLLPQDAYSGQYSYWSNKGDESDMSLTHTFDFTDHQGPLTLSYWTWFDIEKDWDYMYLLASTDGETWDMLHVPSGTAEDPTGNNYGWGYTGLSDSGGEWIQEFVDLSSYAGKEVRIRFEYITDAAVNGEGVLIDNIAIPEIDYFTDFEVDNGGWVSTGFARVANVLPQTFRLALISFGDTTQVEYLTLKADNSLEILLQIGGKANGVDEVVLVVMGTTRFTRQLAAYALDFNP